MKLNRFVGCAVAMLAFQGIATATMASDQDAIIRRLDALEKENAALKQRLNRIERPGAAYRSAAPRAASIDARLATAYAFPTGNYGAFKIEAGYQAAIYFNAISQYSLTSVPTNTPQIPPVGIYLATAQRLQSNFTNQGPYVTGSWAF